MNKTTAIWAAALSMLAGTGSIQAHHSESMFEQSALWVSGRVAEFAYINPHAIVRLEEATVDGQIRRWSVEGRSVTQLDQRGIGPDYLNAGDTIRFCGFPMKGEFSSAPPDAPPFVHGLVLVMPDGTMQMWGGYGVLRMCVRPNDQAQDWADFLNSSSTARGAWCRQFRNPVPISADSKALIGEIGTLMTSPCD